MPIEYLSNTQSIKWDLQSERLCAVGTYLLEELPYLACLYYITDKLLQELWRFQEIPAIVGLDRVFDEDVEYRYDDSQDQHYQGLSEEYAEANEHIGEVAIYLSNSILSIDSPKKRVMVSCLRW